MWCWYIISVKQAYYLKLSWSISRSFILKSLCMGPVLYPPKSKEIYCTVSYQNFYTYVILYHFQKKNLACGSQVGRMWVTSGLLCGSVDQVGWQVWPTFNPAEIHKILNESIANPIIFVFYNPNTGELHLSDSLLHNFSFSLLTGARHLYMI